MEKVYNVKVGSDLEFAAPVTFEQAQHHADTRISFAVTPHIVDHEKAIRNGARLPK